MNQGAVMIEPIGQPRMKLKISWSYVLMASYASTNDISGFCSQVMGNSLRSDGIEYLMVVEM